MPKIENMRPILFGNVQIVKFIAPTQQEALSESKTKYNI